MISAILLAAGQSKRMNGENKLTKEIQGISVIKLSVKNILASSINELIIVLGHQKEIIEKLVDKHEKTKFVFNKNFEISIIDPRGYFASEQRFPGIKIINKWPKEAFAEVKTDQNTALVALTHDPKIDDPALQHALKNKFFYIGALGSKKTHANRCSRLKESGFTEEQINKIFGPIGIKLGGRSAPEIALSIIAQLVSNFYNK